MALLQTSYSSMLKMALPIMFGTFVQSIVLFVDSRFLNKVGELEFGAAGNAGLIYMTLYMIGQGLADGGQIITARRYGEGNSLKVGKTFSQTFKLGFLLSTMLFILAFIVFPQLISSFSLKPDMKEAMNSYLSIRSFGFFFSILNLAFISFYLGIGRSKILIYTTLIISFVNIFLDYVLVTGELGFPEMGMEGVAIATVISEVVTFIFTVVYTYYDKGNKDFNLFSKYKFSKAEAIKTLKLSMPLMAANLFAVGGWTVFFMMISFMGEHPLFVSQIIHKLYFLALIPIIGFAAVTKTYVGNLMANKVQNIYPTIKKIVIMDYILVFFFIHGFILYPELWIKLAAPEAGTLAIEEGKVILAIITGSIIIHTISSVLTAIISGSGVTKVAFRIEAACMVAYLILAYLTIFVWKQSVQVVWLMEYVYFVVFLILAIYFIKKGNWKNNQI